jgi:two-component system chemotaxis response regulator CheB
MSLNRKIRILIVDDSAIVRKLLGEALSAESDIEVVGSAPDPYIARDKILSLKPDVLTLDIEMPRMDGVTFLRKIMQFHPMPVIVISSLAQASCHAGVEALRLGAVDILAKPGGPYSVGELTATLANKIRAAAVARVPGAGRPRKVESAAVPAATLDAGAAGPQAIIAIGASTGGTEAIEQVLTRLPRNAPGIVITQHIPAGFSRAFAERLNKFCPMRVAEAVDGDAVEPGLALIAPGNFHMILRNTGAGYRVSVKDGPMICYQRPSVDVLFSSVAEAAGPHGVGVILTGMGADGSRGLLKMKQAGAATIAQDESTCVVFGMPKEAIRLGGVDRIVQLPQIASAICGALPPVSSPPEFRAASAALTGGVNSSFVD